MERSDDFEQGSSCLDKPYARKGLKSVEPNARMILWKMRIFQHCAHWIRWNGNARKEQFPEVPLLVRGILEMSFLHVLASIGQLVIRPFDSLVKVGHLSSQHLMCVPRGSY